MRVGGFGCLVSAPSNEEAAYEPDDGSRPDKDRSKNKTKYGTSSKAQH